MCWVWEWLQPNRSLAQACTQAPERQLAPSCCGRSPRIPSHARCQAWLASHLKAVLVGHAPLGLPLVAGLPGGADTAGGQVPASSAPLLLVQVELHHLQTDVVAHKVVQLVGRKSRWVPWLCVPSPRGECSCHLYFLLGLLTHPKRTGSSPRRGGEGQEPTVRTG